MNSRLNDDKENKILFDTFNPDLNKVFKNQFNYDLNQDQFTDTFFKYDCYIRKPCKFNPLYINYSPVNYDFGIRSWLKVVFFINKMKVNVVDNSSNSVNSNLNKFNSNSNNEFKIDKLDKIDKLNNLNNLNKPLLTTEQQQQQFILQSQKQIQQQQQIKSSVDHEWLKHLFAGASAGVASRVTCTAPLDRIKVLLQVRSSEIQSIRSCYKFIKEEGGYRSFWRGNGINCIKIAPEIALRFMFYEQFKRYIKGDSDRQLAIYERLISGSLAGSLSQSIIYPMEVIKTRLCLRTTGQYDGIFDAMKKIYRIEGYRTFYRGFCVNLAGILPYSGIDLTVYETLKNFYLGHFQNSDPSVLIVLICGITSNISGQLFSYPLALVRTRLQAIDDKNIGFNTIRRQIYNNHGLIGFYKGFGPSLIKVAPANAIIYIVYEQIRQLLHMKMS